MVKVLKSLIDCQANKVYLEWKDEKLLNKFQVFVICFTENK